MEKHECQRLLMSVDCWLDPVFCRQIICNQLIRTFYFKGFLSVPIILLIKQWGLMPNAHSQVFSTSKCKYQKMKDE